MNIIECGENLSKARKRKGLTQKEIAERLGQKPGYSTNVSFWERGKQVVPQVHREAVARILEIAKSEFVPSIGYVYVFFYPDAGSEENNIYPCKIGHTTQLVEHRVKSKAIYEWGYGEMPEIAPPLSVPVDECEAWEKIIQGILMLNGRWIDEDDAKRLDLKGKEWFYTTPDEVKLIYEKLRTALKI